MRIALTQVALAFWEWVEIWFYEFFVFVHSNVRHLRFLSECLFSTKLTLHSIYICYKNNCKIKLKWLTASNWEVIFYHLNYKTSKDGWFEKNLEVNLISFLSPSQPSKVIIRRWFNKDRFDNSSSLRLLFLLLGNKNLFLVFTIRTIDDTFFYTTLLIVVQCTFPTRIHLLKINTNKMEENISVEGIQPRKIIR